MQWQGDRLRARVEERELTQEAFSAAVGVSRQAYSAWVRGQTPKGLHLLRICRALGVPAESFFVDDAIRVPAHRTRRAAKATPERSNLAHDLAVEYASLLANVTPPMIQAIRREDGAPALLARELRVRAGISDAHKPLDYHDVFRLLDELGICAIFRTFPAELKDYAFYTRIKGHRVIFVNRSTSLLDLNFAVLHECVHAIRDSDETQVPTETKAKEEEIFCDQVAGLAQMPDEYAESVYQLLQKGTRGARVNLLKQFAREKHHAIFGLLKRMEALHGAVDIDVHGADANVRASVPSLGDCLATDSPQQAIESLTSLCPYLMRAVRASLDTITASKLADALELDGPLDARELREIMGNA